MAFLIRDESYRRKFDRRIELQKLTLRELQGGLWHTTHPDRFQRILESASILPEPDIPDSERWKTSGGRELYPYVRILGGVSLFDFYNFDEESYRETYRMCSWDEFVPYQTKWDCAVWIEIDRHAIAANFVSGSDLVARWKRDDAYQHTIMPEIEAAHLGPLPKTAFRRAFAVSEDDGVRPLAL